MVFVVILHFTMLFGLISFLAGRHKELTKKSYRTRLLLDLYVMKDRLKQRTKVTELNKKLGVKTTWSYCK